MVAIDDQTDAVRREVGSCVLAAGEARVVTVGRTYAATVDEVWDACTNPERIPRWFLPISGDLRVGGRYELAGNASGTIERCDPPNGFAATWEYDGEVSWIEVRVSAAPDGACVELDHIAHVDDEHWSEFGPGAAGVGWDIGLLGLAAHLSSDPAAATFDEAEWAATDDGRRFITTSSEHWGDASIAAGTDPDAARAAAQRTTTFYTGQP